MHIVEAKNNLVQISYDTSEHNLVLSGFVSIIGEPQSFIGQVINLEANQNGNFAIVKLIFNFNDEGVILAYNGSVPRIDASVEMVNSQELLGLLPVQNPVLFGDLAQQKTPLKLDISVFQNNLLVCSEKADDNEQLMENISLQLESHGKKLLVFDFNGNLDFSQNKITAGENFKLPLNYESINFIYDRLDEASSEAKALIQDVFLEVQNYVKTLPDKFIPFDSFKDVVDAQYDETQSVELLLLKNKLLKYNEEGIFAQSKSEFDSLQESLNNQGTTIFDLSKIDESVQRQVISYVYSCLKELGQEFYVICNVGNENSDKKLLKQIFMTKNVYSTLICPYAFKYLTELKQLSKNSILFAPIQQQSDFAVYNIFVNKLNPHEFVIYGYSTHHIPFIVKLEKPSQLSEEVSDESEVVEEAFAETQDSSEEETLDEEIKRDVDKFYSVPKDENPFAISQEVVEDDEFLSDSEEDFVPEYNEEFGEVGDETIEGFGEIEETEEFEETESIEEDNELTEDDLDFIDDIADGDGFAEENFQISDEDEEQNPIDDVEESEDTNIGGLPDLDFQDGGSIENEQEYDNIYEEIPEESSEDDFQQSPFADFVGNNNEDSEAPLEEPPVLDILPASMSNTPIVPIYSADVESQVQPDEFEQGDFVVHPKYGKGTVEKLINYGSKTLCSINFENVGRRLLDPNLAELKKV